MNEQEQLDALNELARLHARRVLIELKQSLMPAWVLVTSDKKIQIVGTPWRDEREKQRYRAKLRALMRLKGVVLYSFVAEGWSATLEPEEWDHQTRQPLDRVPARKRPDRQEVVIACACSKDLARWKQWRIVREATTERIIDLVDKPLPESEAEPESWMTEMLKI